MLDLLRNILAFTGTFLVISSLTILTIQIAMGIFTSKPKLSRKENYISYSIGIIIALSLIPFYHFPA